LTDAVGTVGYAFVEIRPRVKRNRENRTIDVIFSIQEGPRVYVERIDITGNVRTIDSVIRREFTLVEGDAFNAAKLRLSRRRIRNLGFFKKMEVKKVRGSEADKTILNVSVEEQSTGEISLGAGFSSSVGVLGDVAIRERNLLGRGQDLLLRVQIAAEASEIELRFTEPHFLNRRLAGGFDLFRTTRDLQDESSFDRKSTGFGLRLGYNLTEQLRQRLRYALSREEVAGVASTASDSIKEQEGTTIKSVIGQVLTYDKRDNRIAPTEGYYIRLTNDLAGLGGSTSFLRNRLDGTHYSTIFDDLVLSVGGGGGLLFGFDDDVLIIDRFFLGGSRLRGFKVFGVGPRDVSANDSVGGKWIYYGSTQVTFPLGLPDEFAIKGRVFTDIGSLGNSDSSGPTIRDKGSLRASAGIGLSWISPIGPIALDLAQAILKEDFDETETVRLNFGTRF
jgi:outer membrane protein insertion porin family